MLTAAEVIEQHNEALQKNNDIDYFYQRALLDSFNLSVGILITTIMIFRITK
jgi:hypothetical protein|tara:strand:- start:204 stop:359 length:156 start_codon:yes stop_codon:yes gene_type:complete